MMVLDEINRELVDLLQVDGRMSYRELGERIGLTAPAVAERVRKLEAAGADYVVDSVAELPAALDKIEARIAAGERPDV